MLLNIIQTGVRICTTFCKLMNFPLKVFLFPVDPGAAGALAAVHPDLKSILETRVDQTRGGGRWRPAGIGTLLLRLGRAFPAMLMADDVECLEHWPALIPFPALQCLFRFFLFQEDSHETAIAIVRSSQPGQTLGTALKVSQRHFRKADGGLIRRGSLVELT